MGDTISTQILDIIGIAYSAIGLAFAVTYPFFFRKHSRVLDYLQWAYFLSLAQTPIIIPFSLQLEIASSFIQLSDQVLAQFYCPMGTYVCAMAYAISFMVILTGFLVIMKLVTIPEKVRQKGINFHRVYRAFKGLFKWFFLPLVYLSIKNLIFGVNSQVIPSAVILAVLLVFPIVQLILYKYFDQETQNPFTKWLQFANYVKAALFCLLIVLAAKYSSSAFYYYLALVLVAYTGLELYMYNFRLFAGKIMYVFGQVVFYFLYSLYVSGSSLIQSTTYLDLYALGLIIALDLIYSIMEGSIIFSQWKNSKAQVIPENSREELHDKKPNQNRYEVGQQFDDSRDQLDGSILKNSKSKGRLTGK